MRRMMAICPTPNDSTSFYRGVGPLSRLLKQVPDLTMVSGATHVEYQTLAPLDALFLQRPYQDVHLRAMSLASRHRVPIWIDYDDDLLSVMSDNPTFNSYGTKAVRERVAKILGLADVVSVSTDHLGRACQKYAKRVVTIPNAIDDWKFDYRRPRGPREKVVLWRGGSTHQRDLMTVAQQLVDASHDSSRADWCFHFQGYNPWWITENMRETHTRHAAPLETMEYMALLEELNPALMVVPLAVNHFNLSKSNCSWLEGSFAGATVIAPAQLPEFERPGVLRYSTPEQFGELLKSCMTTGFDSLPQTNEESWRWICDNATLSTVNLRRLQIIDDLTVLRRKGFDKHSVLVPV